MKLDLATFEVEKVRFSDSTRLANRTLYIDRQAIIDLVAEEHHFCGVDIHLVHPGDNTRLIHVLDAVEPRYKVSGPGTVFPGVLGPPTTVGSGRTHRLTNPVVAVCSEPMYDEPVYWRDSIIDMTGPGAAYNIFADSHILVLELRPQPVDGRTDNDPSKVTNHAFGPKHVQEYNYAARVAGFKVASYLAEYTSELAPTVVESYELSAADPALPKVAYCCPLILHRVYGESLGWQPTFIHPNEMFDGVIFNPYNAPACGRESTYCFQNHPVIRQLYSIHNKEINFVGVLLQRSQLQSQDDKDRTTDFSTKLLHMLKIKGLVLTWIGSGNPGMDTMILARKAEESGIKTTVINSEMAQTKEDPGIIYFPPEADAVVCTGNYEEIIVLPKVEKVLGGTKISDPEIDATGPMTLSLRYLLGSTNNTGSNRLSGVPY